MIPILYYGNETSFTTNGLGRLNDIIECTVTEERNGIYEVEFTYPITGKFYQEMVTMVEAYSIGNFTKSGIIACIHDDHHDIQPFDIYSVSVPIDGVATFNAHHISYRLGGMAVMPFEAGSCVGAFQMIETGIVGSTGSSEPFTFRTDKVVQGNFIIEEPKNVRSILGGEEGSILDIFGAGEYRFDRYEVRLLQNRGIDSGITIRYGKNLMDLTRDVDSSGHYNAIIPFWAGEVYNEERGDSSEVFITLPEIFVRTAEMKNFTPVIAVVDFSQDFEDPPQVQDLRDRATRFLGNNRPWLPDDNIKLSFVQLWQTTEYENLAILQRLSLCDRISVYYEDLGVVADEQEVIKVKYNVLLERYDEMELGKALTSLSNSISEAARKTFEGDLEKAKKAALSYSAVQAAINHATELLTGGLGGHVIFNLNADGEPQEILIMDTDDIYTAMNVIRINKNGIGFSQTGYNGPFTTAWTIDGAFNADFITAGKIDAALIKTGYITDASGKSRWDLTSGDFYSRSITLEHEGYSDRQEIKSGEWVHSGKVIMKLGRVKLPKKVSTHLGSWITDDMYDNYAVGIDLKGEGNEIRTGSYAVPYVPNDEYVRIFPANEGGHVLVPSDIDGQYHAYKISGIMASSELALVAGEGIYEYFKTLGMIDISPQGWVNIVIEHNGDYKECLISFTGLSCGCLGVNHKTVTLVCSGDFKCYGNKNRVVKTTDYSDRLQYAYETAEPYFGDIGEGVIDDDGLCYISIDDIFSETVDLSNNYQVFLQKYGSGDLWVEERKPDYFIVKGTPNLKFGFEIKAKQIDHNTARLEENELDDISNTDHTSECTEVSACYDDIDKFIEEQEAAFDETT